ncbi:MAG: hypothetical protein U0746_22460 [Gemmataceae bacterium]
MTASRRAAATFRAVVGHREETGLTVGQALDAGIALPEGEQAELDDLIRAEVRAAGERAAALLRQLPP